MTKQLLQYKRHNVHSHCKTVKKTSEIKLLYRREKPYMNDDDDQLPDSGFSKTLAS